MKPTIFQRRKLKNIKPTLDEFLREMLDAGIDFACAPLLRDDDYDEDIGNYDDEKAPDWPVSCITPDFLRAAKPITLDQAEVRETCKPYNLNDALARKSETFSTALLRLIDEKNLKDSDVYKRANIDRRLFSKIRGDEDYVPSKKTAIAFCMALHLTIEETRDLLAKAGYALSDSTRFDLIITYLIEHGEYNVPFANIVLDEYGEGTLSK